MRVTVTGRLALLSALTIAPGIARGEGTAELGAHQMRPGTELRVDVRQFTTEAITWSGAGNLTVWNPDGSMLGTFASPSTIVPTMNGLHWAMVEDQQESWDITVIRGTQPRPGRVAAMAWHLIPLPAWTPIDLRLFAKVPGGRGTDSAVVALDFKGLAPRKTYALRANEVGHVAPYYNRSGPPQSGVADGEHPLFLNVPEGVNGVVTAPTISNVALEDGTCTSVVAGESKIKIGFDSNVNGAWHMVCDLNRDGVFDVSGGGDVVRTGHTAVGHNIAWWDGLDGSGLPTPVGSVSCKVTVTVGTTFLIADNANTIFPGLRFYRRAGTTFEPLRMWWDDSAVQSMDVLMPNGQHSLGSSGPAGVLPGAITAAPVPNTDARAFGNFGPRGKGSETKLSTFTWLGAATGADSVTVVVDADGDADGDGLLDSVECNLGTNPDDSDTDGDGINDFIETDGGLPIDTDGDGAIDAKDEDSDGDTLLDVGEGAGDLDTDGRPNFRDVDDDGDTVGTEVERTIGSNPLDADSDDDGIRDDIETNHGEAVDTDDDETIDALDTDSDDDTILDSVEGTSDIDGDGLRNWRDPDDDGDGIPTAEEAADGATHGNDVDGDSRPNWYDRNSDGDRNGDEDEGTGDEDGDGIPNYLDPEHTIQDRDSDGISDDVEETIGTDPDDADTDDDGIPDGQEIDAGSPTRYDPRADTDPLDADTDDDGISDGEEIVAGTDGFVTNPLNPDTDGDGLKDGVETGVTMGVPGGRSSGNNVAFEGTGAGFTPDADPATETDPTDRDTDDGTVIDGTEDSNRNGRVDGNERDPNIGADDIPPPCGNGRPDTGEACDDGNRSDGDGCSAACAIEAGFECNGRRCAASDRDNDGVPDSTDNCPDVPNRGQSDRDGDHIGNVCDPDQDGDGFPDDVNIVGGGCRCVSPSHTSLLGLVFIGLIATVLRRRRA
ncbi:MAG: thrombospondin type 3 repeat-containing protein [Deltaproteobacteria bacterium]|nr:thrombospondin type 3 repeat-containing protein [Deltaproteobacteria bacterium]